MMTDKKHLEARHDLAALLGRVLMSVIFIWSGGSKVLAAGWYTSYFASLGVPFPDLAWMAALVIELGGGLALLLGVQARAAAGILGSWCLITALIGHRDFADFDTRIQFMKNVAMAGGFLFIATFGAGAYTLERLRLYILSTKIGRLTNG